MSKLNEPSLDYAQANRFNAYPDLDAWGDFVFQFMKRNKHRIKYIESWNEPDLLSFANFTLDEYVELQRVFYESAKKAAPDTVVLTGGFAGLKMSPKSTAHPDYFEVTEEKDTSTPSLSTHMGKWTPISTRSMECLTP